MIRNAEKECLSIIIIWLDIFSHSLVHNFRELKQSLMNKGMEE